MSVILELAIFPLGRDHGMGPYIKRVITAISETGFKYQLTSMGTIIETQEIEQALNVIKLAYKTLEPDSERVYCTAKFDISKTGTNRMEQKVLSVKEEL